MKLTFLGAAGTVTGSKYLLEVDDKRILVDCGLFQGLKELRELNWQPPSFDPATIDAVLLTHGHLDHCGYLPRLVKLGFKGPIYASSPTIAVARVILEDSADIQVEEAARANREHYSKHSPALPLYDLADVAKTLALFAPLAEGTWSTVADRFNVRYLYNGHIIGSTFIEVDAGGKRIVFSGDIGRKEDLLLYPPKKPDRADILLIESTYGGNIHSDEEAAAKELEEVVRATIKRGGSLFIPSFAVERTQLLMLMLWRLSESKAIPRVPMIMDSPMGANILDLFENSLPWHKLSPAECRGLCSRFRIVTSYKETLKLRTAKKSQIIIAGSGMVTGGRILSYLEARASNANDILLFVGYQAEGTRGRKLLDGADTVKLYGKTLPFKMRTKKIDGLSAHGDQNDLVNWTSMIKEPPAHVFIIHGEPDQSEALRARLKKSRGWEATLPNLGDSFEL